MEKKCVSCKRIVSNIIGSVEFACPSCSKETIVRCGKCRSIASKYTCSSCGFTGPN